MSGLKYFLLGVATGIIGIGAAALISEKMSEGGSSYCRVTDSDDYDDELEDEDSTVTLQEREA